jgi:hypothetical protein
MRTDLKADTSRNVRWIQNPSDWFIWMTYGHSLCTERRHSSSEDGNCQIYNTVCLLITIARRCCNMCYHWRQRKRMLTTGKRPAYARKLVQISHTLYKPTRLLISVRCCSPVPAIVRTPCVCTCADRQKWTGADQYMFLSKNPWTWWLCAADSNMNSLNVRD